MNFKYIPLTFLKDQYQIKKQIKNTIILKYFLDKYNKVTTLKDLIVSTQYGYNAAAKDSGTNKFLRISDITDGNVNWDTVPFCDCSDEETYLLQNDDLLIARTGGTTGKSFLIQNPPSKSIFAGYLIRIRANEKADPEFLNLFLNSYAYWSQVVSLNKGDFRPSVNATKIKNLLLPDIDIEIQREAIKISNANKINGYEELSHKIEIALNDYDISMEISKHCQIQKELATTLEQSILQEAIQGKLTQEWREEHPDIEPASELLKRIKAEKKIKKEKPLPPIEADEIPFELPDGWEWCRITELFRVLSINGKQIKNKDYLDKGNIPIIDQGKKFIGGYSNDKSKLIEIKNPIIIFGDHTKEIKFVDFNFIPGADGTKLLDFYKPQYVKFIFYLLKAIKLENRGYNRHFKILKQQIIPLPSLAEQKVIVDKVEALMQKISLMDEEIKKSEQYAQTLMQVVLKEAFEG